MTIAGNGLLLTRDETQPFIENGAVVWDNSIIIDIGTTADMRAKYPKARFLDARGALIMPGFINMHHHIYSAFGRGISIPGHAPRNFSDILTGLWWRLDRKLSLEDTLQSARCVYLDCIKNGVTTLFDHHASFGSIEGSLDQISLAAQESGVRTCLCYEVSDRDGAEKSAASIAENERFIKKIAAENASTCTSPSAGNDMQYAMMGLHASFTINDATLEKSVEIATANGVGCHVHTAEDIADLDDSLAKYNKRVVQRLNDSGALGEKSIAVHCVHIDKSEIEILKQTDTMVVHNPQSNMSNAVGTPDMMGIFHANVLSGLGTDGYTSDLSESYKAANELSKHQNADPNTAWGEVPTMMFSHNAKMANRYFKTPLGTLKKGAAADIIITDYIPLTPLSATNANGHILFGVNGRNVVSTIIAGKVLMENRAFCELDETAILAHARELAAKLWERL